MLLKRTQKENLVESTYDSSNILSSKYDKDSKKLTITFKRGVQYTYMDVSASGEPSSIPGNRCEW